ncbi:MAG TPA: hypothetical protein VGP72_14580 [Planctomycetota bacterium]|jgi:hypothetical protein
MRTYQELDTRQKRLVKLCRECGPADKTMLDIVAQSTYHDGGVTTALRSEEAASAKALKYPAVALIDCNELSLYAGLQSCARRFAVKGGSYQTLIYNLCAALSELNSSTKRPVCIVVDHVGKVSCERLGTLYRAADEARYRLGLSVRIVFISTQAWLYDREAGGKIWKFPERNELIAGRARMWNYNKKELKFLRPAEEFVPVTEATPLLDEVPAAEVARAVAS